MIGHRIVSTAHRHLGLALTALLLLARGALAAGECAGHDVWPVLHPDTKASIVRAAAKEPFGEGRFFEVSKNGRVSHVFGTMHTAPTGRFAVPGPVTAALRKSRVVMVEVTDAASDEFRKNMAKYDHEFLMSRPNQFAQHFSEAEWDFIYRVAKARGWSRDTIIHAQPWFIYMLASSVGCGRPRGNGEIMDARIESTARRAGIPVVGLETPLQAMLSAKGFSEYDYAMMIKAELFGLGQLRAGDCAITSGNMYLREEIFKIWHFQLSQFAAMSDRRGIDGITRLWRNNMLDRRNRNWMARIQSEFAAGGGFVAVGAMHLGGQGGILLALQRRGYTIRRLALR